MSFGFGVDDMIAITFKTYQKCSSAPAEFQDLSQMVQSTQRLLCGIRLTIEDQYDLIDNTHKASLKSILLNLKSLMAQIFRDLDKYSDSNDSRPSILTKAKFGTFDNPTVAMRKPSS